MARTGKPSWGRRFARRVRIFVIRERSRWFSGMDRRYSQEHQYWKVRLCLTLPVLFLAVFSVTSRTLPGIVATLLAAPLLAYAMPRPELQEWGTEALVVPLHLIVGERAGRWRGAAPGRKGLLADLGVGYLTTPLEGAGVECLFWPPVRMSAWLSALAALSTFALVLPEGLLVSAAAAMLCFYYAQIAALVHRRGSYRRNAFGQLDDATMVDASWRVPACWRPELALSALLCGPVRVARVAIGVAALAALLHLWLAILPLTLLAAGAMFLRLYGPLYGAEIDAERGERMQWDGFWQGALGPRTPRPGWESACFIPQEGTPTHRLLQFTIPGGASYAAYAAKLPEMRAASGHEQMIVTTTLMVSDGQAIRNTVDPTRVQVVYPLAAPETPNVFLAPGLDTTSRMYYLTAALHPLFTASKLGIPTIMNLRQLGSPRGAPAARIRGQRALPAGVLLETKWRFPSTSLVTPAQVIALRDTIKMALGLEYLTIGVERDPVTGDASSELTIALGCTPKNAGVTRAADLLRLAGLSWDGWMRSVKIPKLVGTDGTTAQLLRMTTTSRGLTIHTFRFTAGIPFSDVKKAEESLLSAVKVAYLSVEGSMETGEFQIVTGDVDPLNATYLFVDYMDRILHEPWDKPDVSFALGMGADSELIKYNFASGDSPHVTLGGTTGSGKSTVLNGALLQLMHNNTPAQVEFWLGDPKLVELDQWKAFPHVKRYLNIQEAVQGDGMYAAARDMLADAIALHNERSVIFTSLGVKNLSEARLMAPDEPMPYLFIILDECSMFFGAPLGREDKLAAEALRTHAINLARVGRSTGIFLVVATQYPTDRALPFDLKTQTSRIGLKTKGSMESLVILDVAGLENIKVPGRGLMEVSSVMRGFRAFLLRAPNDNNPDIPDDTRDIIDSLPYTIHTPRTFLANGVEVTGTAGPEKRRGFPAIPGHVVFEEL